MLAWLAPPIAKHPGGFLSTEGGLFLVIGGRLYPQLVTFERIPGLTARKTIADAHIGMCEFSSIVPSLRI